MFFFPNIWVHNYDNDINCCLVRYNTLICLTELFMFRRAEFPLVLMDHCDKNLGAMDTLQAQEHRTK
jgi:hypothetical protein